MSFIRQLNTADDTKLFHTSKSIKNLSKLVNRDMKHLTANNISLNVKKPLVIFKSPGKVLLLN